MIKLIFFKIHMALNHTKLVSFYLTQNKQILIQTGFFLSRKRNKHYAMVGGCCLIDMKFWKLLKEISIKRVNSV